MQPPEVSRRKFLSIAGASAVGLSSVPGVLANRPDKYEEQYKRALEIRDRTGSHEHFVRFLQNNGWGVRTLQKTERVPLGGGRDDVGAQKLSREDLTTKLTLSNRYSCDGTWYHYLDYSFEWTNIDDGNWDGHGEGGPDHLAIAGHPDHWWVDDGDWYDGGGSELYRNETDWSGVDFEFKDGNQLYEAWDEYSSYVGTRLRRRETSEDRLVRAEYHHVYDNGWLDKFSVGGGSTVSISYNDSSGGDWEGGVHVMQQSEGSTTFC